jgi:phosphoribosylformylglycinamidine synthase
MWEFSESIKGMNDALSVLKCPVVSGNVSFYNEGEKQRIYPTPVIGMVGTGKLFAKPSISFLKKDLICAVVGKTKKEYMQTGSIPRIDILLEKRTQDAVRALILQSIISSCMSIDRGGLWIAIVKSMLTHNIGLHINRMFEEFTPASFLLSESNSRFLITFPEQQLNTIQEQLIGVAPLDILGKTVENVFKIENVVEISIDTLGQIHQQSFTQYFQ